MIPLLIFVFILIIIFSLNLLSSFFRFKMEHMTEVYEIRIEAARWKAEAEIHKEYAGGFGNQQTILFTTLIEHGLKRGFTPSPLPIEGTQIAAIPETHARTHAQDEVYEVERESLTSRLSVPVKIQNEYDIRSNTEEITLTRKEDGEVFKSPRPTIEEGLIRFEGNENIKLFSGVCQNKKKCANLFVTTEHHTRFCSNNCKDHYNRNTKNHYDQRTRIN